MDIKPAEMGLMPALDALLDELNVTHAAARLGISQPALSTQLARLRDLFGDPLLVPASSGRGMTPTPRALAMRGALRAALANLQELVEGPPAFDPRTSRRTFKLVANDNAAMMVGAALVGRIRALGAVNVRIAFLHPNARPLGERLELGEADLGLGSGIGAGEGIVRRRLFGERFMTAQRKEHPRGRGPLDLDAYCRHGHLIISAEGGGFGSAVDRALAAIGRRRQVAVSVQTYALAPEMLVRSDLLCTLPSRFLKLCDDRLDVFETPIDLPEFELAAFWHPRVQTDAAQAWLRDRVFEVAAASDSV